MASWSEFKVGDEVFLADDPSAIGMISSIEIDGGGGRMARLKFGVRWLNAWDDIEFYDGEQLRKVEKPKEPRRGSEDA